MSTQLIGFSVGGILRRFLVQPASMSKLAPFVLRVDNLTVLLASLAYQSCHLCTVQHSSSTTIFRNRESWWYHTRAILLLCIPGFFLLVLVSRLHLSSDVVLQLGLLDRP